MNLLIYGHPGAGKTYFGGSAQDHDDLKPLLVLDIEGGVMTLRHRKDVDVIQIRTMKKLEEAINNIARNEPYYKTVLVDSLTELQKLDMRTVMKERFAANPDKTDIYVPDQRAWGKSGERIRMIVRALRDLPIHTIATALEAVEIDDRTSKRLIHPSIPGKLKSELPGFFDIVGHLKARKGEGEGTVTRTLQVLGTENLIAKDRSGCLDPLITNPSLPLIWEAILDSNSE
jgi:phage nucleotide-binding protein